MINIKTVVSSRVDITGKRYKKTIWVNGNVVYVLIWVVVRHRYIHIIKYICKILHLCIFLYMNYISIQWHMHAKAWYNNKKCKCQTILNTVFWVPNLRIRISSSRFCLLECVPSTSVSEAAELFVKSTDTWASPSPPHTHNQWKWRADKCVISVNFPYDPISKEKSSLKCILKECSMNL